MAAQSLFAFDALARGTIDPALEAVVNENVNNPDYIVSVVPDYAVSRRRCLLTIRNRDPQKVGRAATLAIIESSPNAEIRVEESATTIENGTPRIMATLKWEGVTRENIERQARKFVDDFFRRVKTA